MKWLKNRLLWCVLLNKRFLKKYIFAALLCMVPVLVFIMREAAKQDSSVMTVALYAENENDELSGKIMKELLEIEGLVRYYRCGSAEDLRMAVETDHADCGYIFPDLMRSYMQSYAQGKYSELPYNKHLITVVAKEDSIQTQLVREQLYGILYPELAYEILNQFVASRDKFRKISQEEKTEKLEELFFSNRVEDSIFRFAYLDSEEAEVKEAANYLTAPLRGFLAVFVMLCGFAASMFLLQDRKDGIFRWMPMKRLPFFEYMYLAVAVTDAGVAAYTGLFLSGSFTGWKRELPMLILYIFAVTGFCNVVRQLCRSMSGLGACIPVILLVSFVLCPVFISTRKFGILQWLLPPYFYLNSVHSAGMMMNLAWYGIFMGLIGINMQMIRIRMHI